MAATIQWPVIKPKNDLQINRLKDLHLFTIPNFFTPVESKAFIKVAESVGFVHQGSLGPAYGEAFRDNDRMSVNDPELADTIWQSGLSKLFTDIKIRRKVAVGLNPNIRLYRYKAGQRFGRHIDESVDLGGGKQTHYTLLIYLSGGTRSKGKKESSTEKDTLLEPLIGGETVFYGSRNSLVAEVAPVEGMALLHIHGDKCLLHEGQNVAKGIKYVLRSDVVSSKLSSFPFNSLISGYASGDSPKVAVLVYRRLVADEFVPDMYTFSVLVKACTRFVGIGEGRQVHCVVLKRNYFDDLYVQNGLLHFYGVCGECNSACKVFDEMSVRDVVSWNGLVSGYVKVGLYSEAMMLFLKMDVRPNIATFVMMIVACGRSKNLNFGDGIHGLVIKCSFRARLAICNSLIDMYVSCECLNGAKRLFAELDEKDIVSWTCMISGLVHSKLPKEALVLFNDMHSCGLKPDKITLTTVLSACASLGDLDYGRWVHKYIDSSSIKWDIHVGTAMVDMYAKCGAIDMALEAFNGMPKKSVYTWNALLGGLAMHGHGVEALNEFERMIKIGYMPNEVTFLAILTACCHSGLVVQGHRYFHQMITRQYNVTPELEHYGCMIDLLCKAGLLVEAQELIRNMSIPPDVLIWGALLSACRDTRNFKLDQDILDRLVKLEAQDAGIYVLLSNLHAANQRWDEVKQIRKMMKEKGLRKEPGSSFIEVDHKHHEFFAGDTSHPRFEDVCEMLKFFGHHLKTEENPF
ncbi:unnamed protein product [Rhodiola kirilowii]